MKRLSILGSISVDLLMETYGTGTYVWESTSVKLLQ